MDAPPTVASARPTSDPSAATAATITTAAALALTLGLAAVCWVLALRQMRGMDMGVATQLGSFTSFIPLWICMMAAMMLPGTLTPVLRIARTGARVLAAPRFLGSYLVIWAVVGLLVYGLYRPHGTGTAGAVVIAAGLYELTPLKQHFRRRCRERASSGAAYGLCCVGSSIALMLVLVELGIMSVVWMSMIAVVIVGQKLLPIKPGLDVPLATAIVALGIFILIAPSSVPGLAPSM
jgi:predicted metal-binding membrane protein